jgi:hypothetical protein
MYLYRIYIMNISSNVICTPNSVNKLNLNLNEKSRNLYNPEWKKLESLKPGTRKYGIFKTRNY